MTKKDTRDRTEYRKEYYQTQRYKKRNAERMRQKREKERLAAENKENITNGNE
jgi:hypothetical protein